LHQTILARLPTGFGHSCHGCWRWVQQRCLSHSKQSPALCTAGFWQSFQSQVH